MKKVCYLFLVLFLSVFLNGCSDSNEQPDAVTGVGDDKVTAATPTATKSTFSKKETYKATGTAWEPGRGNGSTFRIPKIGTAFGKTIKVVFSSGYTVIVPDTSKRLAIGKFLYRCGGGSYRNRETWTSHGGVFLAAPANDLSKTVTIYY